MANNKIKTISYKEEAMFRDEQDYYSFQLVHPKRRNWWWLLLLLLPLLLFVKCEKEITAHCVEPQGKTVVTEQPVTISYQTHFLWSDGKFLANDTIQITEKTDSLGNAVFKDLPCSIFSYIFYCMSEASFSAKSDCYALQDASCNFHYDSNVELTMKPRLEDLSIQLRDKETGDVLPDGVVVYQHIDNGKELTDSVIADANGIATLPQVHYCDVLKKLVAKCYGYADTMAVDVPCQDLVNAVDSSAINLKPIKKRFTFFVKDMKTKEPLPNALCNVTLTYPGESKTIITRQVKTSIDGKGLAAYDSAFVLSTIDISARKANYKSGKLETGSWIVEKFIKQEDEIRTIYLEPSELNQELINLDSISGNPIPGVRNEVTIVAPNGKQSQFIETSNRNGKFYVSANGPEKIFIRSIQNPGYKAKDTYIPCFNNIKVDERKIRMQPFIDTLTFRTLWLEKDNSLLPSCKLHITGSISGILKPYNSGNGEFKVVMRKGEKISIEASKKTFFTNKNKVKNRSWGYLSASQEHRDIPLSMDVIPCSGGVIIPKKFNETLHKCSYSMGRQTGETIISGDFYCEPDMLTVYDGPDTDSPILVGPNENIADQFKKKIRFTKGIVTVVIKTSPNHGSAWEYIVQCPD